MQVVFSHEPWRQWRVRYAGKQHICSGSIHANRRHNSGKWAALYWGRVDRGLHAHVGVRRHAMICYPR